MTTRFVTSLSLLTCSLMWHAFAESALAQSPRSASPAQTAPDDAAPPVRFRAPNDAGGIPQDASQRDPTTAPPDIRAILEPPEAQPNTQPVSLPRLGGRVSLANGVTMAVIEVDGNYWIVEQGDEFTFNSGNRGTETLKVIKLSPARVEVKLDRLNQVFSLK